jgi:hypothetical protein
MASTWMPPAMSQENVDAFRRGTDAISRGEGAD